MYNRRCSGCQQWDAQACRVNQAGVCSSGSALQGVERGSAALVNEQRKGEGGGEDNEDLRVKENSLILTCDGPAKPCERDREVILKL
jgi:hypothetical protein